MKLITDNITYSIFNKIDFFKSKSILQINRTYNLFDKKFLKIIYLEIDFLLKDLIFDLILISQF